MLDKSYTNVLYVESLRAALTPFHCRPLFLSSEPRSYHHLHTQELTAGPLYVKTQGLINNKKVWICLYTCCVVRGVHLELVPDLTADSFLRCFKQFTARKGIPCKMISDNGKTFKAAAKAIYTLSSHHDVQGYSANTGIEWLFNLEKGPLVGRDI